MAASKEPGPAPGRGWLIAGGLVLIIVGMAVSGGNGDDQSDKAEETTAITPESLCNFWKTRLEVVEEQPGIPKFQMRDDHAVVLDLHPDRWSQPIDFSAQFRTLRYWLVPTDRTLIREENGRVRKTTPLKDVKLSATGNIELKGEGCVLIQTFGRTWANGPEKQAKEAFKAHRLD